MSYKETNRDAPFVENQQEKEFETRMLEYYREVLAWHKYTLEFLSSPIEMTKEQILNLHQASPEKKTKQMSFLLNNPDIIDIFYMKARIDTHAKYHFEITNCASYASFVSTFSQWMDQNNNTTLFFGSANTAQSPKAEEIGKTCDHFWVKINDQIFDNSKVDSYLYTEHNPILETEDILSGNFKFKRINKI